jgi:hypothetical protein
MGLAIGPCNECGFTNDDIGLTGEHWPGPDDQTYWRVAPGQTCGLCGKALVLFLERARLELPARAAEQQEAHAAVRKA